MLISWRSGFGLQQRTPISRLGEKEEVKLGFEEIEKITDKFMSTLEELGQYADRRRKDLKEGKVGDTR